MKKWNFPGHNFGHNYNFLRHINIRFHLFPFQRREIFTHTEQSGMKKCHIVQFQKISILPPRKVFCFAPSLPPGNSSLASYITSKILTFKTPLPLGISNDLPWGGYGFFLELHIAVITLSYNAWLERKLKRCLKPEIFQVIIWLQYNIFFFSSVLN